MSAPNDNNHLARLTELLEAETIPVLAASPIARVLGTGALVRFEDKGICNDADEEFAAKVALGIDRLIAVHPGLNLGERVLNVFGYGHVVELLADGDRGYFWGHDAAEALGWDAGKFQEWARLQYLYDLETQREHDLERGTLGWECIRFWPMGVSAWTGEGKSDDHTDSTGMMTGPVMANWTDLWLIDTLQLTQLAMCSPWGKEVFEAARPMFSHAFAKSGLEDRAADVPTMEFREVLGSGEIKMVDSQRTLADAIAQDREGITEQEAINLAMRGPVAPAEENEGGDA